MDASLDQGEFRLGTIPEDESGVLPAESHELSLKSEWLNDSRSVTADSVAATTRGVIDEQYQDTRPSTGATLGNSERPIRLDPDSVAQCRPKLSWKMWLLLGVLVVAAGGGIFGIVSAVNANAVPQTDFPSLMPSASPSRRDNDDFYPTDEPSHAPSPGSTERPTISAAPSLRGSPPTLAQESQNVSAIEMQTFLVANVSNAILDPTTPHYYAFNWLAYLDDANLTISTDGEWRVLQRYLLGLLYYSVDGESWFENEFLSPIHECDWKGIRCGSTRYVKAIILESMNLRGSLPSELSKLTKMQWLVFADNNLTGTIPETWYTFANLTWLELGMNEITGSIPTSLWNLTSLEHFAVDDNKLIGKFPEVTNSKSPLVRFDASRNQLTGTLPSSLWKLTNLTRLILNDNTLTGGFPPFPNDENVSLKNLSLQTNQLYGTLPTSAGQMTQLVVAFLHGNRFSSTLPQSWLQIPTLRRLDLSDNTLSGTIPATLANCSSLEFVHLNNNSFSGQLPKTLPNAISDAWFQYNNLTGPVPQTFGAGCNNLTTLLIQGNSLSGSVPEALCASNEILLEADCLGSGTSTVQCSCCKCH